MHPQHPQLLEYKAPVYRFHPSRSCCMAKGYGHLCLEVCRAHTRPCSTSMQCKFGLNLERHTSTRRQHICLASRPMLHAGQVMLVWPHQMYLTGITAGVILMVASGWFSIWSMWILVIFYMEHKKQDGAHRLCKSLHVHTFSSMLQYCSTIEQQAVQCH